MDDGSADDTTKVVGSIIDEHNNCNIRLLCQGINKGSSATRNLGIKSSKGKYITFVDADDTLKDDYIASLISLVNKSPDCDIYITGVETYNENGELYEIQRNENRIIENRIDIISDIVHGRIKLAFPTWCKVIKKFFLIDNNLEFDEDAICMDDGNFYSKCYLKVEKVCMSDYVGYQWRRREGSISARYYTNTSEIADRYRTNCHQMFEKLPQILRDDQAIQWMNNISRFCFDYAIDHLERSELNKSEKKKQLINIVDFNLNEDVLATYTGYKKLLLIKLKNKKRYGYYSALKLLDSCKTFGIRVIRAIQRRIPSFVK